MQIKPIGNHFEQHNQISDLQKTGWLRVCMPELVEELKGRLLTTPSVLSHQLAKSTGVSHSFDLQNNEKYCVSI